MKRCQIRNSHDPRPQRLVSPDALREAMNALPDGQAGHMQRVYSAFVRASIGSGGMKPADVAAFIQEGMAELLAYEEAPSRGPQYRHGGGAWVEGHGALGVAVGAERMTGLFAFGPIASRPCRSLVLAVFFWAAACCPWPSPAGRAGW